MSFPFYITYLILIYLRPVETYFPELYEFRPVLAFGALTLILSLLSNGVKPAAPFNLRNVSLACAFIFIVSLSRVIIGWPGGALDAFLAVAPPVALFIMTVANVDTLKKLKVTLVTIFICSLLLVVQSVYSYHTGYKVAEFVISQGHLEPSDLKIDDAQPNEVDRFVIPANDNSVLWRIRSVGELRDPNDFAQSILAASPILIVGFLTASTFNKILLRLPLTLFLMYGLLLTGSRGAVVTAAALAFFSTYRRIGKFGSIIILLLVLFGGVILGFSGGRGISAGDESAGGRIEAWSVGLSALAQRPIFGVGYGRFLDIHNYTAHNSYVLVLTELGFIGYLSWVALAMNSFFDLLKGKGSVSSDTIEFQWATAVLLSFISIMVSSIFLSRSYATVTFLWFGLASCAGFICSNSSSANGTPKIRPLAKSSLLFCFTSFALIYASIVIHNLTK